MVTDEEAMTLFHPQELRTISRCEVKLFGNTYYSAQWEEFHGEQMRIAYDIHDPAHVWVHNADGCLVAVARLNANSRDYMPRSYTETVGQALQSQER